MKRGRGGLAPRLARVVAAVLLGLGNLSLGSLPATAASGEFTGSFSLHFPTQPATPGACPEYVDVPDVTGTFTFTINDPPNQDLRGGLKASGSANQHEFCPGTVEHDESATVSVEGAISGGYDAASGKVTFTFGDAGEQWQYHITYSNCVRFTADIDLAPCQNGPYDSVQQYHLVFVGPLSAQGQAGGQVFIGEIGQAPDGQWSAGGAALPSQSDCPAPRAGAAGSAGTVAHAGAGDAGGCSDVDVTVDHMEVVQVVQDAQDTVPLVASKKTVVRVFLRATGPPAGQAVIVDVSLFGLRDGNEAAPRVAATPVTLLSEGTIDRGSTEHSALFVLPATWTAAGSLGLEASATPRAPWQETTATDNDAVTTAEFVAGRTLDVVWVPVCMGDGSRPQDCPSLTTEGSIPVGAQTVTSMYPVPDGGVQVHRLAAPVGTGLEPQRWNYPAGLTSADLIGPLLSWLGLNLTVAKSLSARQDIYLDQLIGVVTSDTDAATHAGGAAGMSYGGHVAYIDDADVGFAMAHEIGHNLGLNHIATDDPACGTPKGPFDPGPTAIGEVGFDTFGNNLVSAGAKDLMSYCHDNRWISPAHYRSLIAGQLQPKGGLTGAAALDKASQDLIVTGTVRSDGSAGTLDPAIAVPSPAALDNVGSADGPACITASGGAAGSATVCFDVDFTAPEAGDQTASGSFIEAVPDLAGTQQLSLTWKGHQLAVLNASTQPKVDIAASAGETWTGPTDLSWTVSNGGPTARTLVVYSPDGGSTWLPFAIDPQGTSLNVDPTALVAGSSNLFRVLVSDGVHTATADAGPITVPDGIGRPAPPTSTRGPDAVVPTGTPGSNPLPPAAPQRGNDDLRWFVVGGLLGAAVLGAVLIVVLVRPAR